jgi:mannose-1-phosphate guanylyltransferase/mannose-6-phosphate isomerase
MIKDNKKKSYLIPVVLSGGTGSRLWPLSREGHPKPFIKLFDGETLLEKTYHRIKLLSNVPKINKKPFVLTVTNQEYYFICKDELEKADLSGVFLLEPEGRNTAPAIAIAALWIKKFYGTSATMLILPADHLIQNPQHFALRVTEAYKLNQNQKKYIVTFGIKPKSVETGFGYIESGDSLKFGFKVNRFYEKPSHHNAIKFSSSKNFYWNSGIFFSRVSHFLKELSIHSPTIFIETQTAWKKYFQLKGKNVNDNKFDIPKNNFKKCPNISIDYALLEKSKNVAIIPTNLKWSDIGSWLSFSKLIKPDKNGNSISGDGLTIDSKNTFIQSGQRFVAAVGVRNLIIIDTPDALLVIDKSKTEEVKRITSKLKKLDHTTLHSHKTIKRPWGNFTTLQSGPSFKIKCIEVEPLKSLSLQSHKHRSEHWIVIEGEAEVFNQNKYYRVKTNESTFIAQGEKHRLINPSSDVILKVIEVQSGIRIDENDIQRFEDQYGRI